MHHFSFMAVILTLAMITGCATAGSKANTVPDPHLTGTWEGHLKCGGTELPVILDIGAFDAIKAAGRISYTSLEGKKIDQPIEFIRNRLENPSDFRFGSKDYNVRKKGSFYVTEGLINRPKTQLRFTRLISIPGCSRMTIVFQQQEQESNLSLAQLQSSYLPVGSWLGRAKCSRTKRRYFKFDIQSAQSGVQSATISSRGFNANFKFKPISISELGTVHYQITSDDSRVPRGFERPSVSEFYEIEFPIDTRCGKATLGLFEPVENVGGAYAEAFKSPEPFCDTFGYWFVNGIWRQQQALDDLYRHFGQTLKSKLSRPDLLTRLFSGANKQQVYGVIPKDQEKVALNRIDRQLAACVKYTSEGAKDAQAIYTKKAFAGTQGQYAWKGITDSESGTQHEWLSDFSRHYLSGQKTIEPKAIVLPAPWQAAVDQPDKIQALAQSSVEWVSSQDILAVQKILLPHRKTLVQAKNDRDDKLREVYRAKREVERPLEHALQQHLLKDCTPLGQLIKSEGTAFVGKAVRNGAMCESTTLGTTVSSGIRLASDFQCSDGKNNKICTFNVQMACAMRSEFGDPTQNRRLSSLMCAPITAVSIPGKAMFLRTGPNEWVASEVTYR